MWTKGSSEVYLSLNKTAGCLVEQAEEKQTEVCNKCQSCAHMFLLNSTWLIEGGKPYEANTDAAQADTVFCYTLYSFCSEHAHQHEEPGDKTYWKTGHFSINDNNREEREMNHWQAD